MARDNRKQGLNYERIIPSGKNIVVNELRVFRNNNEDKNWTDLAQARSFSSCSYRMRKIAYQKMIIWSLVCYHFIIQSLPKYFYIF